MQTPDEWLADFERKVADLQQKATEFKRDLESAGATRRSADGSVSVTVAPNGALLDLRIEDSALRGSGADLAARILAEVRDARRAAAQEVAGAFVPLGGDRELVQPIPDPVEPPAAREVPPRRSEPDEDFEDDRSVFEGKDKW